MSNLHSQTEICSDSDQLAIRDGRMFRAYFKFTVAGNATKQILIKTSPNIITVHHGRFIDAVGSNAQFVVYSNPIITSEGTESFKKFNLNALSSNVTAARFWENPTVSNKGTEVDALLLAGGNQSHTTSGSRDVMEFERIFPQNAYFLTEFTNLDNMTLNIVYKVIWEEVPLN